VEKFADSEQPLTSGEHGLAALDPPGKMPKKMRLCSACRDLKATAWARRPEGL
jgi:hypothetical protein